MQRGRITKLHPHGVVDVTDFDVPQGARVVCHGEHGRVVALRDTATEVLLHGTASVTVGSTSRRSSSSWGSFNVGAPRRL